MADQEQVDILRQGARVWNEWRKNHPTTLINLTGAALEKTNLSHADLEDMDLLEIDLQEADLSHANLSSTNFSGANLFRADVYSADLSSAIFRQAYLPQVNFMAANLWRTNLSEAIINGANFTDTQFGSTNFGAMDLSDAKCLEKAFHRSGSTIGVDTLKFSRGKVPESFMRGCGLSDWEIEQTKLYNPDLSNDDVNKILYRMYELRATQALQISPLFISYSHADDKFVNKIEGALNKKGIRFWRDIHEMKAGRMEKQIDRAISQNPTVLLVLSERSLSSDWVEHEVREARKLEKQIGRDVLCPVTLDESWKSTHWPKRIMEQIIEYNILDFSAWQDNSKFDGMFRRLIDGLELFYKG